MSYDYTKLELEYEACQDEYFKHHATECLSTHCVGDSTLKDYGKCEDCGLLETISAASILPKVKLNWELYEKVSAELADNIDMSKEDYRTNVLFLMRMAFNLWE